MLFKTPTRLEIGLLFEKAKNEKKNSMNFKIFICFALIHYNYFESSLSHETRQIHLLNQLTIEWNFFLKIFELKSLSMKS